MLELEVRNKNMTFFKYVVNCFMIILCVFSTLYILEYNIDHRYKYMFILPITFCICYIGVFAKLIFSNKIRLFYLTFFGIGFFRYVLLPIGITYIGGYNGRSRVSPSNDSFIIAHFLMWYELVIAAITIFILEKRNSNKVMINKEKSIIYPKNHFIYLIFILVSTGFVVIFPDILKNFNFFIPKSGADSYFLDTSVIEQSLTLMVTVSKQLLFVIFMGIFKKKHNKTKSKRWIILSITVVLLNCGIYSGLNRSDFVMLCIASFYLFVVLYPQYKKKIIFIVAMLFIIILPVMAQVRGHKTLVEGNGIIYNLVDNMQIYLGGPYNVAMAVDTANFFPEGRNFANLLNDIFRGMLGFNLIFKLLPLNTSTQFFNYRIYFSGHSTQIIPVIGQGYFYMGIVLAPLLLIGFIVLANYLAKKQEVMRNIEFIYFFTISITRIGFIMGQNAQIQLNDLSFSLFIPVILYYLNKKIVFKKK